MPVTVVPRSDSQPKQARPRKERPLMSPTFPPLRGTQATSLSRFSTLSPPGLQASSPQSSISSSSGAPQSPSAPRSSTCSFSLAPQSPSAPQSSYFPPLWGSSAPQFSTTPPPRATQAPSASQPRASVSITQQRSRKEIPCGNSSGTAKTICPDNKHCQQSESPNEACPRQYKSEDIISRDTCVEPPESPSYLLNKSSGDRLWDFSRDWPSISRQSRGPQAPSAPSSNSPPSHGFQAPSSPQSSTSPSPGLQAPSAPQSSTPSWSQVLQSPSAPRSSDFSPLWGSSAPQPSTTPPSRATQAPSAPQSPSSESLTQQFSRKENPWGNSSGTAQTIRSDKCAKPKKPTSSPPNRDHEPGQDPCYYEREMKKREKEVEELKVELKKLEEKERRRAHELSLAEKYHEETIRVLQSKIEPDGMQTFTERADQASVADVFDLVKALNAAILQASAFISDPQQLSSLTVKASELGIQQANEVVRTQLGGEMAEAVQTLRALRKELHIEDPMAVQLALSITMTELCDKIINAWTQDPVADKWLKGMYEKIRANESQAVAGRWRALTRAQAGGAKDSAAIVNHLIDRLGLVLLAVGSEVLADQFRSSFQKHLTSIADNVIRIQITAGESITSMDVMPYFYAPGTEFRKDFMDDMFGFHSTKDIRKGPILGATELGLWLKEKKADVTGQLKDANISLLKAKVLFASALRE